MIKILVGNCLDTLKNVKDGSVNCCVTSPPYYGLRDYQVDGQLGLEETPEQYVQNMVEVFREIKRILKDDGTLWLNLGDSYAGSGKGRWGDGKSYATGKQATSKGTTNGVLVKSHTPNLKPKDLIGIPWKVAFALQADGWYLRQDIIWCLSGGTYLYVRTQKGDSPMRVRDMARLDPSTVQLWNGDKWTRLLGTNKNKRSGDEIELVLRSGERISCTPTHKFPTTNGLKNASELRVGDCLIQCVLPEPEFVKDCSIDLDAAWFAGLYLAEGSRSRDTIQIAGHSKETTRLERLGKIAKKFGGYITHTIDGNNMAIRMYGKILNAVIDELVSGKTAKNKGFSPVVWKYSNSFLEEMLNGYLSGDGHLDGDRWRLGFCRNYNLEKDLRTVCARLGYTITLNISSVLYNGKKTSTFRGEIRKNRSGHHNEKNRCEIVRIQKARCREVYDLGVEDEPHVFALSSGVLSHNSKPNPMPESVRDRCTKAHEYIFLLSKSSKYYYDCDAIKEPCKQDWGTRNRANGKYHNEGTGLQPHTGLEKSYTMANKRSVWSVTSKPFKGAHFATFPQDLIKPCVIAGCPENGVVLDPFGGSGTTSIVAEKNNRNSIICEMNPEYVELANNRIIGECPDAKLEIVKTTLQSEHDPST